jgi:hypothetical protein
MLMAASIDDDLLHGDGRPAPELREVRNRPGPPGLDALAQAQRGGTVRVLRREPDRVDPVSLDPASRHPPGAIAIGVPAEYLERPGRDREKLDAVSLGRG